MAKKTKAVASKRVERTEVAVKDYGTLRGLVSAVGVAIFAIGDEVLRLVPKNKVHWKNREGVTVTETDIFRRMAEEVGSSKDTLRKYRDTCAAFPKKVRRKSVAYSVYEVLATEAAADNGARRTEIVGFINETKPTVSEARDHADLLRVGRNPLDKSSKSVKPTGHDNGAEAPKNEADTLEVWCDASNEMVKNHERYEDKADVIASHISRLQDAFGIMSYTEADMREIAETLVN